MEKIIEMKNMELTQEELIQHILNFDVLNAHEDDARSFIAWLQMELKNKKELSINN